MPISLPSKELREFNSCDLLCIFGIYIKGNTMRNIVCIVAFAFLFSGCATGPSYKIEQGWVKENIDQAQAKRQLFDCKEKAKSAAERETQIGGLTESCMSLEGYSWGEYKTALIR